jgi:eukaryotic-like serine/threonine-protein kinase
MQGDDPSAAEPRDGDAEPRALQPTEIQSTEIESLVQSDWLPSRPPALGSEIPKRKDLTRLAPGQRLGEFVIRRVIGRGGFAAVYLALQWSLDREVALKVTIPQSWDQDADDTSKRRDEGQHLAQLNHPNIVQVYQQTVEPHTGAHLLCMQYIAGATLELLISKLKDRSGRWTGSNFLDAINQSAQPAGSAEASGLQTRQALQRADHVQTICQLGCQLGSALQHAHRRGIFHRDIKPANVLVNQHGQPLLADFNLAVQDNGVSGDAGLVGGTLVYMSPEDLEAFATHRATERAGCDGLGDLYSLGVLLWQTSTGELPFPDAEDLKPEVPWSTRLNNMAQRRRETSFAQWTGSENFEPTLGLSGRSTASIRSTSSGPILLDGSYVMLGEILRKCLQAETTQRFQSAQSLANALSGLAELHGARKAASTSSILWSAAERFPIIALLVAAFVPHLLASALQISYNVSRVLQNFQPNQTAVFVQLVWWANPIIYGICLAFFYRYLMQILPVWQRLRRHDHDLTARETAQARRHALRLPKRTAMIAGIGWMTGAVVFPGGIILLAEPLPAPVLLHFLMSFVLAGLISVTYSAFGIATVVIRVFYLRFWLAPTRFHAHAQAELTPLDQRLERITFLAGTIPLAAAMALVFAATPGDSDQSTTRFRILTVLLILAGGLGFSTVGRVVAGLRNLIRSWINAATNP